MSRFRSRYRAGDRVEVKSREEILATLDHEGALDKLPFMPEMLRYCGERLTVVASAHKTCDTVNKTGGRRMHDAVHLEGLRCDGSAHGGCQARCLFFWKEAWLKPAGSGMPDRPRSSAPSREPPAHRCDADGLVRATTVPGSTTDDKTFVCQATRLYAATTPLPRWTVRQYIADVSSRNVAPLEAAKVLFLALVFHLRAFQHGYRLTRWLYDRAHRALRGRPGPYGNGLVPPGEKTPRQTLDLQVGELVRVKSHAEILATVDGRNRNRGLSFDKEMVRYCGEELRVGARVERIIDESTGKMLHLPTPSIILEGAYCTSQYSERRLLCPRKIVPYWREIWLERLKSPGGLPEVAQASPRESAPSCPAAPAQRLRA